jgi:eukaryotic-like serine/threonine-protein kinase
VSQGSPTEEFGPYLVYEQLGVGGMAQVHRAVATGSQVERPVALKRMLSHIAGNEEMVKSFVREARLASYLRHENVAQTYDLGRVGDVYFIVMELITGRNLREVLRHCGRTTGPMPVQVALNILNQICDALDYAHNLCDETGQPLGIIHRDVSPSNVIVSDSGAVKLIDFGIAKASATGMQTMGGTLKGKFGYMAPEYIAGRIDARADLFAVGVIAHELLTNRPLFQGRDDIDTLTRVRDMRIEPPSRNNPAVPPEIDDVVMTALERDPDRRWQHATALRTALTTLTRRLGLVASNPQVVAWLDWAFAHAPRRRSDGDTDPNGARVDDDPPSIAIDPRTPSTVSLSPVAAANLAGMSQNITLIAVDKQLAPPPRAPAGTPGYVPAQRDEPPRSSGLAPGGALAATRPGAGHPARRPSASSPPPSAGGGSGPPPSGPPSPVLPAGSPTLPAGSPTLFAASSVPAPGPATAPDPAAQAGFPPRPPVRSPAGPVPHDVARSAQVQRELAHRVSSPPIAPPPTPSSRVFGVVLVLLAATAAAVTVYFVLPLLT